VLVGGGRPPEGLNAHFGPLSAGSHPKVASNSVLRRGWGETLDLARRVHPGLRRAVVIVGSTAGERFWLESARRQLAAAAESIEISYLVDSNFRDVLRAVAALPKDSVVLVGPFLRDGAGRDFSTPAVIARLAGVARVPIYGLTEGMVGSGIVGGYVVSYQAHGRVAAELALRVLAGERPEPTGEGTTTAMFDDRQIARWKIDRRLLPPDGVVLFQKPSPWTQYRGYVVGAALLVLVQMGFIAALLMERAQRRRTQRGLADRLRFETLLSDLSHALASCSDADIDREIEVGLRRIVEDLGTDRATLWAYNDAGDEARVSHTWTRPGVPPVSPLLREKDFPRSFAELRAGRVLRIPTEASSDREGLVRTQTLSSALAPLVEGGRVVGSLSVGSVQERHWPDDLLPRLQLLANVFAGALSRQRAAHAARESARDIRDLAGRLMTAQEEERRRIARELHDGVNQDLAALSIALSAIEDDLPEGTPIARRKELSQLQERAVELAETIRHMSHELHPGVLQYAGLAAALRSYCREFERDHGLAVAYRADDDLGAIPADVALCLYRVTQEALKNISRHANASHAWVSVGRWVAPDLTLSIRDDGRGFDLAAAHARGGLGLISLDERVRIAGGRLIIASEPDRGTEIRVVVRLADLAEAPRDA